MEQVSPLLCHWWGHDLDPDACHYYGIDYCVRCERQVERNTGVLRLRELVSVRIFLVRRWVDEWLWGWRVWWKCNDCGKRFGRHDDNHDHIPF